MLEEEQEKRLKLIQKELEKASTIYHFDDEVFNKVVNKIVIGEFNKDGTYNPNVVKFILNFGNNNTDGEQKLLALEIENRIYKS